jgi:hypothetical protein
MEKFDTLNNTKLSNVQKNIFSFLAFVIILFFIFSIFLFLSILWQRDVTSGVEVFIIPSAMVIISIVSIFPYVFSRNKNKFFSRFFFFCIVFPWIAFSFLYGILYFVHY